MTTHNTGSTSSVADGRSCRSAHVFLEGQYLKIQIKGLLFILRWYMVSILSFNLYIMNHQLQFMNSGASKWGDSHSNVQLAIWAESWGTINYVWECNMFLFGLFPTVQEKFKRHSLSPPIYQVHISIMRCFFFPFSFGSLFSSSVIFCFFDHL